MIAILLGVLAGAFALGRLIVVLVEVSKPNSRVTLDPVPWAIWSVLTAMTVAPQIASVGWQWALLLGCANLTVNLSMVALSLTARRRRLMVADAVAVLVAATGIVLWVVLDNPATALSASLVADFVGVWRAWAKASRDPNSEVLANWVLGGLAAQAGLFSALLSGEQFVVWYPLYACNAFVTVGIILWRRRCMR